MVLKILQNRLGGIHFKLSVGIVYFDIVVVQGRYVGRDWSQVLCKKFCLGMSSVLTLDKHLLGKQPLGQAYPAVWCVQLSTKFALQA